MPDKSLLGKQIGVVNNDKKHKVFEGVSNFKNFKICLDKGEHCRQLRKLDNSMQQYFNIY
ncbi:hypothetical protein [Acetivibrio saccincola]|uniref:hypothetical protein n=1 Tax=Acetivibrio saccincola TaxID=1677857 RepID=UPI0010575A89|nr:hypothetical protein [Acetivibrio saccincola]